MPARIGIAAGVNERLSTMQFQLLAMAVAAALLPHLSRLPSWLTLALVVAVPLRVWLRQRGMAAASRWVRLPLTLILVVLTWREFGQVFSRDAGAVLATGLLALKLLETERRRDARVALGFSAFVLMSALLFDQGLIQTLMVCTALVVVFAALVALQPALLPARRPFRRAFGLSLQLFGCGIPLALAAFVLIPRLSAPLWGAPNEARPRIGLNDDMQPGSMTDLLIDDTPALRLQFSEGMPSRPDQQFLRAVVLWNFDGQKWTAGSGGEFMRPDAVLPQGPLTRYKVTLEANDRRWLPALDVPVEAPEGAHMTSARLLLANERLNQPRSFELVSALNYRLGSTLSADERRRALALPAGRNPRSRELGESWQREHPDDPEAIIDEALTLYNTSFTYTLVPPLLGRESVDEFLFSSRAGFCEHYASSFVVLMRAAGLPARVVTGYQGGWWSAASQYLLIRHSDAHAWAEVWIDALGWLRVDPTAAIAPERIIANDFGAAAAWQREGWVRDLRNRFDGINRAWTEAVVQFNALRQKQALQRFGIREATQRQLLAALGGVIVATLLVATLWAMWRPRQRPLDPLDRAWRQLCRRIARHGVQRLAHEGPNDFAERVASRFGDRGSDAVALIARYVQLRYAPDRPDAEPVSAFAADVRKLSLRVAI